MTDWLYCNGVKAAKVVSMNETANVGIWELVVEGYTGATLEQCELRRDGSAEMRRLMPLGVSLSISQNQTLQKFTFANLGPNTE